MLNPQTHGFVFGVQHSACPLPTREALAKVEMEDVMAHLRGMGVEEGMVLSTCNRFEVYGYSQNNAGCSKALPEKLADLAGLKPLDLEHVMYHKQNDAMVRHGFGVAASVHSMVVGEPQILGQMKRAWQASKQAGHCGVFLNRFVPAALRAGKRVRTETSIALESVSISAVAVRLAKDIYQNLEERTVLLIGAGEMSESAAQSLKGAGIHKVLICNRSIERAQELAQRFDAEVVPFENLMKALERADVVLASTASRHYMVTQPMANQALKQRKQEPILFVDMAVPRDVDPLVHKLDNCYVYDVDALGKVAKEAYKKRSNALGEAEKIILEEAGQFMAWYNTRKQTALIKSLRAHFDDLRQEVLAKGVTDADEATRLLMNKILHTPSARLRSQAFERAHLEGIKQVFAFEKGSAKKQDQIQEEE